MRSLGSSLKLGVGVRFGFGPNRVRSLPDGVAQALLEYIENTDEEMVEYLQIDENSNGHNPEVKLGLGSDQPTTFKIGILPRMWAGSCG